MASKAQQRPYQGSIMSRNTLTGKMLAGILIACVSVTSCSTKKETKISNAQPGDTLAIVGDASVILDSPFKPGQPNGLFDGGIKFDSKGQATRFAEVNVVCSMPDLPNWPEYDNIYGRWLEDNEQAGEKGGETDWQLLSYFDGKNIDKGQETAPRWAKRLSQNLCRKGDFQDR